MGLDQYLRGRKSLWQSFKNPDADRKEDGFRISAVELDLGYWRKHPNLHGYIIKTFAEGHDECQDIDLDAEQIERIIQAVADRTLPHTVGFFFGVSDGTEREEDLATFHAALKWLQAVPELPPMFVDEGQQNKELHELNEGLCAIGMTARQVNLDQDLPRETRSIIYRASW